MLKLRLLLSLAQCVDPDMAHVVQMFGGTREQHVPRQTVATWGEVTCKTESTDISGSEQVELKSECDCEDDDSSEEVSLHPLQVCIKRSGRMRSGPIGSR